MHGYKNIRSYLKITKNILTSTTTSFII